MGRSFLGGASMCKEANRKSDRVPGFDYLAGKHAGEPAHFKVTMSHLCIRL